MVKSCVFATCFKCFSRGSQVRKYFEMRHQLAHAKIELTQLTHKNPPPMLTGSAVCSYVPCTIICGVSAKLPLNLTHHFSLLQMTHLIVLHTLKFDGKLLPQVMGWGPRSASKPVWTKLLIVSVGVCRTASTGLIIGKKSKIAKNTLILPAM